MIGEPAGRELGRCRSDLCSRSRDNLSAIARVANDLIKDPRTVHWMMLQSTHTHLSESLYQNSPGHMPM